jgi:hypothetical protein
LLITALLTLLILAGIDVALTRTPLLDRELSIADSLDMTRVGDLQTYRTFRTLAGGRRDGTPSVVLLGDSRIWFAARGPALEQELKRLLPERSVRVENLGAFGVRIGDIEAISRYLDRLSPAVVVVALGGEELVRDPLGYLATSSARVFDLGWRDGPLPPDETGGRLDRWLRTIWPLYRLRVPVRLALGDWIFPSPAPPPRFPDALSSQDDLFAWAFGDQAPQVGDAYRVWRVSNRLADFLRFVQAERSMMHVASAATSSTIEKPAVRALEALLTRSRGAPWATRVLLLPRNPVLDQDRAGRYHSVKLENDTAAVIRAAADRNEIPVIDARRWVSAGGFFDFVHVFPNFRDFQEPLARELASALASVPGAAGQ